MDYMILECAGRHYAIPSRYVAEVVEPVTVTPLPFVPNYIEGLARIAGKVMMQIGLAARLGGGQSSTEAGVLIVVRDSRGHDCALHTDRVLSYAAIGDADINVCLCEESVQDETQPDASPRFIRAEFQWEGRMVMELDADSLLPEELACRAAVSVNIDETPPATERRDDTLVCMVVESGGERYALPLDEVAEVAECDRPTALPHAPREVAGMVLLRGNALLTLSLDKLLGRDQVAHHGAVVVIHHHGVHLGLLVEKVLGIRHFGGASIHPVDKMGAALSAYAAEADGKLTGIINRHGLISESAFDGYRKFIADAGAEIIADMEDNRATRMLGFSIGTSHCALPLDLIERVEDAHDIADVGDGAESISGAALILGEVVPVVDLRREIGGTATTAPGVWLVVRQNGEAWALAVDKVERVVEILARDIEAVKRAASDYIGSVGRVGDRLFSILTLDPLTRKTTA